MDDPTPDDPAAPAPDEAAPAAEGTGPEQDPAPDDADPAAEETTPPAPPILFGAGPTRRPARKLWYPGLSDRR